VSISDARIPRHSRRCALTAILVSEYKQAVAAREGLRGDWSDRSSVLRKEARVHVPTFAALVVAALLVATPQLSAPLRAQTARQCKTTCKQQKKQCTNGFRGQYRLAKEECARDALCRKAAKQTFRQQKGDCKTARASCRACCSSGQTGICSVSVCGDGVLVVGEECDDGTANSDSTPDACRTTCRPPWCGDGVVDSSEQCEPPGGDGCDADCAAVTPTTTSSTVPAATTTTTTGALTTTTSPTSSTPTTTTTSVPTTTTTTLVTATTTTVPTTTTTSTASTTTSTTTSTSLPPPVPQVPSIVTIDGRRVIVQRARSDGSHEPPEALVIRGINWSPASRDTNTSSADPNNSMIRRREFGKWYMSDIPLMRAMNANVVRTFMDLGLPGDPGVTVDGRLILDEFHRHGIMVIMTVDDAINDLARAERVVEYYRDHPAILAWSLGSEWSINRYFGHAATVDDAAQRTEVAALLVKDLDPPHPVVSSYGTILDKPNAIETYVSTTCPSVDIWSVNEYRGAGFTRLFEQWAFISGKPMFVAEYGIDAYDTGQDAEDPITQGDWVLRLWNEIERNLAATGPDGTALGGTLFEFNDEWWKTPPHRTQDSGGWSPPGFPDGMASEDWWGIVTIDRIPRLAYEQLASAFEPGHVPPPEPGTRTYQAISRFPVHAELWENGAQMYVGRGAAIDGGRGFNIAAIDPTTGRLRDPIMRFDTWGTRSIGSAMTEMIDYLDEVPDGTILLIAVGDEAGLNGFDSCTFLGAGHPWVEEGLQVLEGLGSELIRSYCYRDQWSMIAVKGQGVALGEALARYDDRGSAASEATIVLP
jgi:hypothetical protein